MNKNIITLTIRITKAWEQSDWFHMAAYWMFVKEEFPAKEGWSLYRYWNYTGELKLVDYK